MSSLHPSLPAKNAAARAPRPIDRREPTTSVPRPPQNTPADRMPIAVKNNTQGATRPIHPAIRKGIAHAATPGNTPNSLERLTRRLASNLLGDNGNGHGKDTGTLLNKIAPSYERRFAAGLSDLDRRLTSNNNAAPANTTTTTHAAASPSPPGSTHVQSKTEWPASFSDVLEGKS